MERLSGALSRAKNLLNSVEFELRDLIAESLAAQRYDEVAELAAIARRLFEVAGNESGSLRVESPSKGYQLALPEPEASTVDELAMRRATSGSKSNGDYPHFEREGNRLVKIGWSKKDRRVYEHKTPFTSVSAVCDVLRRKSGKFLVDQILPIKDAAGTDVPSYQAYLVLAWLRKEGLVERNGNDGYTATTAGLSADQIAKRLHSLPPR